jgi:hypothetical protein
MKKISICILSLFLFTVVKAQVNIDKKVSPYTFNLTFTPQLFFNGGNVENDGKLPETISTRNTGGYTLGAELERKGKHGLILNAAIQYGKQSHDITMGYQSLSFFDPSVADQLTALGPVIKDYKASSAYINFRFMVGYEAPFTILNGCKIDIKAGVSTRFYVKGYSISPTLQIQLLKNDTLFVSDASEQNIRLGSTSTSPLSWNQDAEFYIGLCKNINGKFIKNFNVGIEVTRGLMINGESGSGSAYVESINLYKQTTDFVSVDKYEAKDFSIGLRLAIGLWHK